MNPPLRPLEEQTIVITGASSGIGLTTSRMAARQGARVVMAARNESAMQEAADQIKAEGGDAFVVPTDVGYEDQIDRLAQAAIDHYGGFDTWVNNAAVSIFGNTWDVATPDMRRMFDVVYWHVVYGSRAALRHYKGRMGSSASIINVGSLFGDRVPPLQSTYASAKSAVHGFTDGLRTELEAAGAPVSVTLLHPGRIDTPFNEHALAYTEHHPSHRDMVYAPDTVADAILFAASHGPRDLYIGSQAKAWAVAGRLAPRVVDTVASRYLYWGQTDQSRPAQPREQSGLYGPGQPAGLERGTNRGFKRARSYYLLGEEHRYLRDGALVGVAGSALGARRRRERR
jgi:NAD(P)-dependent dehydrogenase (short-subunit alcohol dehydrogenase family)